LETFLQNSIIYYYFIYSTHKWFQIINVIYYLKNEKSKKKPYFVKKSPKKGTIRTIIKKNLEIFSFFNINDKKKKQKLL